MSATIAYPSCLEIEPLAAPARGICHVPGSKSIGNRALVLAALGTDLGPCLLEGLLDSEDTRVMIDSLEKLGFDLALDWSKATARVARKPGDSSKRTIPAADADLQVCNSGTTMRFLTPMVATGIGRYRLDGNTRMRQRPIADLLSALRSLGVAATGTQPGDFPPLEINTRGLPAGDVSMRADISSQFLSGLLLSAPKALGPLKISVEGTMVSEPYVDMTVSMLRAWGYRIDKEGAAWKVSAPQSARLPRYRIEPDASAASYFWAAAAVTGGEITVAHLGKDSLQGDVGFVEALAKMGCGVRYTPEGITVKGGELTGIDLDMNAISDTVMTLAVVACFAKGPTNIRNVAHIRHKETDRITAIANELNKIGAQVETREDGLTVYPGPLHGSRIHTYDDHRMAMSLSVAGLRVPGIVIEDPGCVRKTYPGFFQDWERLRQMSLCD